MSCCDALRLTDKCFIIISEDYHQLTNMPPIVFRKIFRFSRIALKMARQSQNTLVTQTGIKNNKNVCSSKLTHKADEQRVWDPNGQTPTHCFACEKAQKKTYLFGQDSSSCCSQPIQEAVWHVKRDVFHQGLTSLNAWVTCDSRFEATSWSIFGLSRRYL